MDIPVKDNTQPPPPLPPLAFALVGGTLSPHLDCSSEVGTLRRRLEDSGVWKIRRVKRVGEGRVVGEGGSESEREWWGEKAVREGRGGSMTSFHVFGFGQSFGFCSLLAFFIYSTSVSM